ncbi:hypothetical protein K1719_043140 [Acacia pycnantha]|nr:hypothetical protein K1719_043140 [Acacia pycnantha]
MSWRAYVDEHLMCEIDGHHLIVAAIVGLDGSVWARAPPSLRENGGAQLGLPVFYPFAKSLTEVQNDGFHGVPGLRRLIRNGQEGWLLVGIDPTRLSQHKQEEIQQASHPLFLPRKG